MRHSLKLHPHSLLHAGTKVEVEVARPHPGTLVLCYLVTGNVGELRIPAVTAPARSDDLWRHTCFEAFVRASGADYWEFNFSPATEWAAYRFSGYRAGSRPAETSAPLIKVQSAPDRYSLKASLQLDDLSGLANRRSWRIGLSALLEDKRGRMSYWALVHPSEKPDFHHPDSFAYELAPAVHA